MPARRPVRVARGFAHQRRRTAWASFSSQQNLVAAAGRLNFDLLSAFETAGASLLGCTVGRTHIGLNIAFLAADAVPAVFMGVIRESEALASASGLPDPSVAAQQEDDWSLLQYLTPAMADSAYINGTALEAGWRNIDIRSKRTLRQMGERYWLSITNVGGSNATVSVFVRTLVHLP